MLAWNPARDAQRGEAALFPWPDSDRRSRAFSCGWGACNKEVRDADFEQRRFRLACQLVTMMVSDGVDPQSIHRACWPLQEYRDCLPHDARGPDGERLPPCELRP
jgi:hypothetical protein